MKNNNVNVYYTKNNDKITSIIILKLNEKDLKDYNIKNAPQSYVYIK